jgi:KaiC/GvpD/RAD55 family RecA-like ATPase
MGMNAKAEVSPMLQWALYYESLGLSIIPTAEGEKRPGLASWTQYQQERPNPNQITLWLEGLYRNSGIGLVTGQVSGNVFVVDADAGQGKVGPETLDDLQMMHDDMPLTWSSKTGGGGRHYFFRAPPGVRIKTSKGELGPDVDVRGEGGFLVLPPSPHPSGQSYQWVEGAEPEPNQDLSQIAEAPQWLLNLCRDDAETPWAPSAPLRPATPSPGEFNAFGGRIDGREHYMRDLLWARMIEERRSCPLPLTDDVKEKILTDCWTVFERKVRSRSGTLETDGRGLDEMRRKLRFTAKKWDTRIAAEAARPKLETKSWGDFQAETRQTSTSEPAAPKSPATPLRVVRAFPIDSRTVPRRPWILRGQVIRNHVDVLVAPPGSGKSLFTCQRALALASGIAWGGWAASEGQQRVLLINSEDDVDEMRRRLAGATVVMGIDQSAIVDRILLADAPENIVIARTDPRSKAVIRSPLVESLIETITAEHIDVVVVDPFAETFEGDENSNSELKWAAVLWREIARRTNSAVSLVHHTRKYASGMSGDADAARGASALIGVARVVTTMFDMTEAEAEMFGILVDERRRYVRHDDAKANLSLVTGAARWFEKRSQEVGNQSIGNVGDEVGVLVPWSPPGLFDGVSIDTLNRALSIIDQGILDDDGRPTGKLYSPNKQGNRWAGTVLIETLGCDEKRAKDMLKAWLKPKDGERSGLLIEASFYDGKQDRKGLRVDNAKRPGRVE